MVVPARLGAIHRMVHTLLHFASKGRLLPLLGATNSTIGWPSCLYPMISHCSPPSFIRSSWGCQICQCLLAAPSSQYLTWRTLRSCQAASFFSEDTEKVYFLKLQGKNAAKQGAWNDGVRLGRLHSFRFRKGLFWLRSAATLSFM